MELTLRLQNVSQAMFDTKTQVKKSEDLLEQVSMPEKFVDVLSSLHNVNNMLYTNCSPISRSG